MAEPRDKRRRGGHELPDSAQDRPEQNRGYDEAVRGGQAPEPQLDEADDAVQLELLPEDESGPDVGSIDDEAARRAAADVRRRERRSR